MAPGGGYAEGMIAQEENMFRRTDCHFSIDRQRDLDSYLLYNAEHSALVDGCHGRVYLDKHHPRVCIRGPEDRNDPTLGYRWLQDDEIFPFLELRSAAVDLRITGLKGFDPAEMAKRIAAQLDTLIDAGVRHVVLSAFGCGAFGNPAQRVARLYREQIEARAG